MDTLPIIAENESSGHAWQSSMLACATSSWYVFCAHDRHTLATAPTVGEYCPATQLLHAADPNTILYFPATHEVHGPPSGPVEPALQVQSVETKLPVRELEFAGHCMHVEAV
mgnify:CR=1 FL=1